MSKKQKYKTKIADLENQILENKALQASNYHFAGHGLDKLTTGKMMGSAVIVQMRFLGGKEVCEPFAILDGLSDSTIASIKADLERSFDVATMFKPLKGKVKET